MLEEEIGNMTGHAMPLSSLWRSMKASVYETISDLGRQRKVARVEQEDQVSIWSAVVKNDWIIFESACVRFSSLVDETMMSYEPSITQDQIYDVPWGHHGQIASLLIDEKQRIVHILKPAFLVAGFPRETCSDEVDKAMTQEWQRALAQFHKKAFSHLHLPRCFALYRDTGLLDYEPVRRIDGDLGMVWYEGEWSGIRYPTRPSLAV
jgi:hypothetical protein